MWIPYQETPKFNSAASCDLLEVYRKGTESRIREECARVKSRTFSPSGFRCLRYQWFKLRGVTPDVIPSPDLAMDFMAEIGTSVHKRVQRTLVNALGDDWIPVDKYLRMNPIKFPYRIDGNNEEYETFISIDSPPVRFACDGIIRICGKLYLLEIKSCDRIQSLEKPKDSHIDQVQCYSALLGLHNVLMLYVDRQTGDTKCFEVKVTDDEQGGVIEKMYYTMDMVEKNIAPEKLSVGAYMCSNCPYQVKCKEW